MNPLQIETYHQRRDSFLKPLLLFVSDNSQAHVQRTPTTLFAAASYFELATTSAKVGTASSSHLLHLHSILFVAATCDIFFSSLAKKHHIFFLFLVFCTSD